MRDSFTPEEVDRIEEKAYEVGVGIGASQERERIIALLEEHRAIGYEEDITHDKLLALIKGENNG